MVVTSQPAFLMALSGHGALPASPRHERTSGNGACREEISPTRAHFCCGEARRMLELKVGVIGCGGHAQSHFDMIREEPRMRLVAIAEIDEERRVRSKEKHAPQYDFADYREMLDKVDLDVV